MAKMLILRPSPELSAIKQIPNSASGFTLIEMLVVLAIMSLAAVLFASGAGRSSVDQRADIHKLERAINETRTEALESSTIQTIDLQNFNAALEPALGETTNQLIFHADGSTNGGIILSQEKKRFNVRWIDGKIEK